VGTGQDLSKGRIVEFSLVGLFPPLSYPVVVLLDRATSMRCIRPWSNFARIRWGRTRNEDLVVLAAKPEIESSPIMAS